LRSDKSVDAHGIILKPNELSTLAVDERSARADANKESLCVFFSMSNLLTPKLRGTHVATGCPDFRVVEINVRVREFEKFSLKRGTIDSSSFRGPSRISCPSP
jgi:hypothetical protein